MSQFNKYRLLKLQGKTPHDVYLAAKSDGVDEITCIRLLREVFGLSLVEAKKATGAARSFDEPQKVEIGGTVYWEGSDTIHGLYVIQAKVDDIRNGCVSLSNHKKWLVRPEGIVEVPAEGALKQVPLKYFEKSLLERIEEANDFWRHLSNADGAVAR